MIQTTSRMIPCRFHRIYYSFEFSVKFCEMGMCVFEITAKRSKIFSFFHTLSVHYSNSIQCCRMRGIYILVSLMLREWLVYNNNDLHEEVYMLV
jgi:hypothetical protein